MSEFMHFVDAVGDSACVCFLKGTADIANHELFQKAIKEAEAHAARNVVLDIRHLGFVTSLAVGEMLRLHKAKRAAGGAVVIAGPNTYIEGVFKAARLGAVMKIVPTVEEGLAVFATA